MVNQVFFVLLLFFMLLTGCSRNKVSKSNDSINFINLKNEKSFVIAKGNTIQSRFEVPSGYVRTLVQDNSFEHYLRNFPLLPDTAKVYYYDGRLKPKNIHAAILNIDIGDQNLQQCADAVIRLRAEYLYGEKRFSDIHFSFNKDFNIEFKKWAEGFRVQFVRNQFKWVRKENPDYSYSNFKKYLFYTYIYAGTYSLSSEMKIKRYGDMKIGDVFIKGGSPGHAMIIVDMAVNPKNNKKVYMLAQSYMPAQSIHIVKNLNNLDLSPWYELNLDDEIVKTPEWKFTIRDLKEF